MQIVANDCDNERDYSVRWLSPRALIRIWCKFRARTISRGLGDDRDAYHNSVMRELHSI